MSRCGRGGWWLSGWLSGCQDAFAGFCDGADGCSNWEGGMATFMFDFVEEPDDVAERESSEMNIVVLVIYFNAVVGKSLSSGDV